MNKQRSQIPLFLIFSLFFLASTLYLISTDPFHWFETKGNQFVIQWLASRSFAKENLSPYSSGIQSRTEEFFYGAQATSNQEKLKFSSPLYSVLILLPFALVGKFEVAQFAWMLILGILLAVNLGISLNLTDWKPSHWVLLLLLAFSFFGYYNFQALASGSLVLLSALFIFLALLSIRYGKYEIGGLCLALATIQPRAVLLVILFILFWSLSKRLWTVAFWFLAGVTILIILGLFFIPDWPIQYFRTIFNYKDYFPINTPVTIFSASLPGMGRQLGWGLSLLMIIVLIIEWLAARKKDFTWFLWTVSLTIVAGQWVGIPAKLIDLVLLILPMVLILATLDRRFLKYGKWMAVISLVTFLAGLWGIYYLTYQNISAPKQDRLFLLVIPAVMLVGLYWVRWWAIRPYRGLIEELRVVEGY